MGIWNLINGVWRRVWSTHVRINDVWRDSDVSNRINGVWRTSHRHELLESNIIGFRLVYQLIDNVTYPALPHLRPNPNIPVDFDLTGDNRGMMDTTRKGVIFHYRSTGSEEGIKMYAGALYAVLDTGDILNLSRDGNEDRIINSNLTSIGINESWSTSRIERLIISIDGYTHCHKPTGYVGGWLSLFDKIQHFERFPNDFFLSNDTIWYVGYDKSFILNPTDMRAPTYDSLATIGIARDFRTPDHNMVGSFGALDHTFDAIYINGNPKPFSVEIVR